jgi:hypothetical protein
VRRRRFAAARVQRRRGREGRRLGMEAGSPAGADDAAEASVLGVAGRRDLGRDRRPRLLELGLYFGVSLGVGVHARGSAIA